MSRLIARAAAIAAAVFLPAAAHAGVVQVRDNPNISGVSVFASGLSRNVSVSYNGARRTVSAGAFALQQRAEGESFWTDFFTFCTQYAETLTLPREHVRVNADAYFGDNGDKDAISRIYGAFLDDSLGLQTRNAAAAVQLLIWEIMEDGAANLDLSDGSFRVRTASARNNANAIWARYLAGDFSGYSVDVLRTSGSQDLLTSVVPVPGALVLLLSGLTGLGFASRKREQGTA